jgi:hypothetical protein
MMALTALLEPRKMHPKMIVKTVVRIKALSGCPSLVCTFAKTLEAGSPPSRAKAYVIREEVVIIDVVAKRRQIRGNIRRQTAPARLFVAL